MPLPRLPSRLFGPDSVHQHNSDCAASMITSRALVAEVPGPPPLALAFALRLSQLWPSCVSPHIAYPERRRSASARAGTLATFAMLARSGAKAFRYRCSLAAPEWCRSTALWAAEPTFLTSAAEPVLLAPSAPLLPEHPTRPIATMARGIKRRTVDRSMFILSTRDEPAWLGLARACCGSCGTARPRRRQRAPRTHR